MRSCSYCGNIEDIQRDHVIPNSFLRSNRRSYKGDWLVPSCGECNNKLNDSLIFTIPERAFFLKRAYEKKYKKILRLPEWDEDELKELSDRFRDSVLSSLRSKRYIENRIEHLKIVSSMDNDYLYPE